MTETKESRADSGDRAGGPAVTRGPELDPKVRQKVEVALSEVHPCLLLRHVECVDNTTGDSFRFHFSPEQLIKWATTGVEQSRAQPLPLEVARKILGQDYTETGWEWQGDVIDGWLRDDVSLILKARQLGITWCAAGVALWIMLYIPGMNVFVQSKTEADAADLVDHIWEMFLSLEDKSHLRNGVQLETPAKITTRPHTTIELVHRNGKKSKLVGMASTSGAGHGRTGGFAILDEFSRHAYARQAFKALIPAQGGSKRQTGKMVIISTANGISIDEESGNYFHYLWANSRERGIKSHFLPWDANPDRDEEWYQRVAMKLPPGDRAEQYPRTPEEAFLLTGSPFFDVESLVYYHKEALAVELMRGMFVPRHEDLSTARFERFDTGAVAVYHKPKPEGKYAMGVDVATGVGKDASCAYVIDLETMQLVAEIHSRELGAQEMAEQIHFLGKWYNWALVAVELGGGYGDTIIHPLRDGSRGRPPYRRLYRHRDTTNLKRPIADRLGFPITQRTRPQIIAQAEEAIRQRAIPEVPTELLGECRTFVHRQTRPSPAAAEGSHDDRVMAFALTLELYRKFGAKLPWDHREVKPYYEQYPWQRKNESVEKYIERRYPRQS